MPTRKRTVRQAEIVRSFAERLRSLRNARGMTQRELATRAEVTFSYISRLEAGGAAPGIDLVERLADALSGSIADLLPISSEAEDTNQTRRRVKELFDTVLPNVGPETLSMLLVFVARIAESPGIRR